MFFVSFERLTPEDKDNSADIYMWSEEGEQAGHPLTLISKGNNSGQAGLPGNTDDCAATWTSQCNAVPIRTESESDNALAEGSGELYFYSPEQLDGARGLVGQRNVYVYRNNKVQYVTTLEPYNEQCKEVYRYYRKVYEVTCTTVEPITRIQVSPNGNAMAFITHSQITAYDNTEAPEMYQYNPARGDVSCVSCQPTGESPPLGRLGGAEASLDGLFMSNDGRTFFYTAESLVPTDTNEKGDVYEFVGGRPQLITTGTGSETILHAGGSSRGTGLEGVSGDGVNVYFSTYSTLVGQDENGNFLKFYDARTDGGFPFEPKPAECDAADECKGASLAPPAAIADGTGASLGNNGNYPAGKSHVTRTDKRRRRRRAQHFRHQRLRHGAIRKKDSTSRSRRERLKK